MMNLAIDDHRLTKPGPQNAALRDYDCVRRAIAFISEHWRAQPTIEAMADAASLTPDELHHLFRRWAALTPKAFMQALTLDHAKGLLRDSASVLDAALDSPAPDDCTICSSPMRRCRRENGKPAAPG
jgi:AraC family transcriptional regulator of adaptative response/methylated-DNA-[protein]-cysteine methyltransferase